MKKQYDSVIESHYRSVADEQGLSPSSTMADEITRQIETDAVVKFVGQCLRRRNAEGLSTPATILDIGCGNGYTLQVLLKAYKGQRFLGIEKSEGLRSLAESRFAFSENIEIRNGDVRDEGFVELGSVDILICQRVIINLLDGEDQTLALNNMIRGVASPSARQKGGCLLFIEAFAGPLINLNNARHEFDFPPLSPADHNLYLSDDFFDHADLKPFTEKGYLPSRNFLSTHYYVTRVLHAVHTRGKPLRRNSEFVRFFSQALRPFAGDYSPLKLYMFEKV